jgi:glycosyltransferase involved in cell wall biosynthesis
MCNSLETGGIERQFNILAKGLRDQGRNVLLGCLSRTGAFLDGLGEVVPFSTGGSFLSRQCFRSRFRLARHFREHSVLVAHSFDFYSNLMMVSVARLARVPAVIACQNQLGDLLTPNQNRAELANFHLCHRVVCNSGAALERLARLGIPRKKLVLIPNGIAPEAFVRPQPFLPRVAGRIRIGVIARMNDRVKNQEGFLRAAAKVAAHHVSAEFVLAGDGPLRSGLERLTRDLAIQDRVLFLGDRRDVGAVLSSLDIAVIPSHSESLSNSLLEAMAAGKAVVATDAGGTPEVVHHGSTGLLVRRNDVDALAAGIEQFLLNPELRHRCGLDAGRLALEYTYDKLRDRHIALYSELLDERLGNSKGRVSCVTEQG